jgi:hypothetical protein
LCLQRHHRLHRQQPVPADATPAARSAGWQVLLPAERAVKRRAPPRDALAALVPSLPRLVLPTRT